MEKRRSCVLLLICLPLAQSKIFFIYGYLQKAYFNLIYNYLQTACVRNAHLLPLPFRETKQRTITNTAILQSRFV